MYSARMSLLKGAGSCPNAASCWSSSCPAAVLLLVSQRLLACDSHADQSCTQISLSDNGESTGLLSFVCIWRVRTLGMLHPRRSMYNIFTYLAERRSPSPAVPAPGPPHAATTTHSSNPVSSRAPPPPPRPPASHPMHSSTLHTKRQESRH